MLVVVEVGLNIETLTVFYYCSIIQLFDGLRVQTFNFEIISVQRLSPLAVVTSTTASRQNKATTLM